MLPFETTFPCLWCCIAVHFVPPSHQDDSDEEPSTADQTPEHDELMEYVSLSCEEGEATTSSEVSPRVPSSVSVSSVAV